MSGKEPRIFVGGLSRETSERHLHDAFTRFGKVVDAQIMQERETGRPRGFGFVTFSDRRAMEDAIREMHNQVLDGRTISVNKAVPKVASDDRGYGGYDGGRGGGGGYSDSGRGGYRGSSGGDGPGGSDCFKCGHPGHWARDCPSGGGGGGGKLSSRSRFDGDGGVGREDRYSDRYGDRDRVDSRDRYGSSGRDRYGSARSGGGSDRYGGAPDRYPHNGYGKERSYDRDGGGPRGGGGGSRSDRYGGGGPARYEGGGSYRERPGPYDRPSRGGRQSSLDGHY
ncbi:uncharacterized protein M6B38_307350 [Iris pallida]|uniref:Uncharacterized protein n=2 Tax=Iris pallida TaxID=29817 RepID=A0AAX6EAC6_IRIPA|nr:uncharacterized protein M6B38_199420 [Iris pallida]KAJ6841108.1 uncharacterized protein M6B38_307350 [Iris pallida]